ncbi:restriction endonuclease subunit S [Chromobacterium vaccinii]|uniref:restriction endonuclease subunit S n=1 Tax=Chromobacterium vaccinii TaxID=1108595 RepID=UPI000AD83D33|nr:restriction endonuclease subunit S [Chromobacterium vaccinii]
MSSEWMQLQIRDLGKIVTGKTPATARSDYFGGDIPFLTPTDMVDGLKTVVTSRTLTEAGLATVKNCLIPKGISVSCIGWQMGKSVLVSGPTVTNQQINTLVVDEARFDLSFVYYLLTSMRKQIFELGATPTRTPIVNKSTFGQISVCVPRLNKQKELAAFFTALDDRITLLRETNATLEAIAQALFKSWFVDFDPVRAKIEGRAPEGMDEATAALFPDGFEESELGLVPRGWRVCPIGDVVESVGGGTPNTKESSFWEPGEYCWTTPKDLSGVQAPVLLTTERKLSAKGLSKVSSGLLPAGTLLMSSRAPIGYLAIAQTPLAINQGYIAMLPSSRLPPLYMLFWCRHNMENIKGRANGSTFMEISKKAFRPIPALVPPEPILAVFVDVAEPLFTRLVENEKQAETLAALRDTLLPRLISGQLRLPEAEALIA